VSGTSWGDPFASKTCETRTSHRGAGSSVESPNQAPLSSAIGQASSGIDSSHKCLGGQTGAIAPSLDTSCTNRTAHNISKYSSSEFNTCTGEIPPSHPEVTFLFYWPSSCWYSPHLVRIPRRVHVKQVPVQEPLARAVAVQVAFERQTLKPVFHLIGYRLWV
jgi:hypothetical protein